MYTDLVFMLGHLMFGVAIYIGYQIYKEHTSAP